VPARALDLDEIAGAEVLELRIVERPQLRDGPGLRPDQVPRALRRGERLDESASGFGLPITRELAELYGGKLDLGISALGGLRVSPSIASRGVSVGAGRPVGCNGVGYIGVFG
jgi:signal transduction histidine kinase